MYGTDRRKVAVVVLIAASILLVLWLVLNEGAQNDQVVQPFPNVNPAPVVPELPNIIADLNVTKTCCENNATAAKQFASGQRSKTKELDKGRKLYQKVETETNALIVFLQAALVRRFNDADPATVEDAFERVYKSEAAFQEWADKFTNPQGGMCGAAAPGDLLKAVTDWLADVRDQNEKAIDRLRSDLEACRMTPWSEL
jgi:hypothetical protein